MASGWVGSLLLRAKKNKAFCTGDWPDLVCYVLSTINDSKHAYTTV